MRSAEEVKEKHEELWLRAFNFFSKKDIFSIYLIIEVSIMLTEDLNTIILVGLVYYLDSVDLVQENEPFKLINPIN